MRKPTMWFSTRSDKNGAIQAQKMARRLETLNSKSTSRGIVISCRKKKKGADQLCSYCLRFRICRVLVFLYGGSNSLSDSLHSMVIYIGFP